MVNCRRCLGLNEVESFCFFCGGEGADCDKDPCSYCGGKGYIVEPCTNCGDATEEEYEHQ